jgi:hypothetical protein
LENDFTSLLDCFESTFQRRLWYGFVMTATVEISFPEVLIKALGSQPEELPRQALEAVVAQAFRKGQITHAQVGELLKLNRFETEDFLKNAAAFRVGESEEFSSDIERLRRIVINE